MKAILTTLLILFTFPKIYSQIPSFVWATSSGGAASDEGRAICTDPSGNVYITGYTTGSTNISFGSNTVTPGYYLAKYDPAGNALWVRGSAASGQGRAVCSDATGYVYVTGYFSGTCFFGTSTLVSNGAQDIFVAKYDSLGGVLWAKSFGTSGTDQGNAIKADKNGNIFAAGQFVSNSVMIVDTQTLTSNGYDDAFLIKFDTNGNLIWARNEGSSFSDAANAVAVDTTGNVIIAGFFQGTLTIGPSTIQSAGVEDIFVAKYSASGTPLWAGRGSGSNTDEARSLSVDNAGNIYLSGAVSSSSITFNNTPVLQSNIFLAKYDNSGNFAWAAGANGPCYGQSLVNDMSGNVLITGFFTAPALILGSFTLTNPGGWDIFVAKYDPAGNVLWAINTGGACDGEAIASKGTAIYLTGAFHGSTQAFGSCTVSNYSAGNNDIFLTKLDSPDHIEENELHNAYCVFPVPAHEFIYTGMNPKTVTNYSIKDVQGKLLLSGQTANGYINIETLSSGVYFLCLDDRITKIVKE